MYRQMLDVISVCFAVLTFCLVVMKFSCIGAI